MLSVVIVEDEQHNREDLKDQLLEIDPTIKVLGEAAAVGEAVELIANTQPDVVLMDIELHEGNGFDVINQLSHLSFDVVFTTAFEHYALKAIKFSSLDYLLKPVNTEELRTALHKASLKKNENQRRQQLEVLLASLDNRQENRNICLSTADGIEFIQTNNILYCEANGSYTNFILKGNQKLIVSKHLKEYETLLADHDFMRVHNSFLINLKEVKRFVKSDGGYILMNNDATISISQKRREDFLIKMAGLR